MDNKKKKNLLVFEVYLYIEEGLIPITEQEVKSNAIRRTIFIESS